MALFAGASTINLDGLKLTDYVKRKIGADRCQYICGLSSVCRYRTLIKSMDKSGIDFQIAGDGL